MFGSGKVAALESQIRELKEKLESTTRRKTELEKELSESKKRIADLEKQVSESELEQLKRQAKESMAEYEALKELYSKKVRNFDSSHEEKEADFAREAALERFNLETEIIQNRKASEEHVSKTVETFADTFQYYLNQIRLLTEALGKVASKTGQKLFSTDLEDLKMNFGLEMADELKSETDTLQHESGNLILIGTSDAAVKEEKAEKTQEENTKISI